MNKELKIWIDEYVYPDIVERFYNSEDSGKINFEQYVNKHEEELLKEMYEYFTNLEELRNPNG